MARSGYIPTLAFGKKGSSKRNMHCLMVAMVYGSLGEIFPAMRGFPHPMRSDRHQYR